jgi:hypothetical protein
MPIDSCVGSARRPAQELKGPANAAPFCSSPHTVLVFASTHPLHFSVAPRRLGRAVGSFAAAPGQTLEKEYEDGVEERGWRMEMEDGVEERGCQMKMEDGDEKLCVACLRLSAPALALYLV